MPIRWEKFTVKAQEAVQRGNDLASEHGNPELVPLHLLAALLEDKEGIVQPVVEKIGIGPQATLTVRSNVYPKFPAEGPRRPRFPRPQTNFWNAPSRKRPTSRTNMSPPSTCCYPSLISSGMRPRKSWRGTAPPTTPF